MPRLESRSAVSSVRRVRQPAACQPWIHHDRCLNPILPHHAAWPAQLDDAKHVLDWVLSNPLELPIDPQRIAVWGQSAGGHIATMLALTARESVKAIVAMCTPFDLADSSWTAAQAADSPVTDLLGGPQQETIARRQARARSIT